MQHKSNSYRSLQKALEILLSFSPLNQAMGTNELSRKFGLHKSTVSRILHVLTDFKFLYQDPDTKKYRLSNSAAELGRAVIRSLNDNLVGAAKPHIDNLRNRTNECVVLEVMAGDHTILAYKARGRDLVQVETPLGGSLPIHAAAGAKMILAFSPPKVVNNLIKGKLPRLSPNTITNARTLKSHLVEIRQKGVAFDRGERDIDVCATAAPIFNHAGMPVAAVVIVAPIARMENLTRSNTIFLLKETASVISAQLLFSDDLSPEFSSPINRKKS